MIDKADPVRLFHALANQGRLIEAGWLSFRLAYVPTSAPEATLDELRTAFFAGANHLFVGIQESLGTDDLSIADYKRIDLIEDEIHAFIIDFQMRKMPPEGNA